MEREVEQATAAPGEKRNGPARRKLMRCGACGAAFRVVNGYITCECFDA